MGRRLLVSKRKSLLIAIMVALAAAGLLLAAACIGRFAPASPTLTPPPTAPVGGGGVASGPAAAMTAADFPTPPDRDLTALARQFRGVSMPSGAAAARFANQELQVGHRAEFWIADLAAQTIERAPFRLGHISPRAYWWVEDGLDILDADLAHAAAIAEPQVLAPVYAAFAPSGSDRTDGMPRLHIVHDHLRGVGGYASASDAYPAAVAPYSNEINAIYINTQQTSLFDDAYLATLAHELQHAIQNQADATEEGWLNEGLAELAIAEAGLRAHSISAYLERPRVSLVNWPAEIGDDTGVHYGAAALFAHYLREHYAGGDGLIRLLGGAADGIAGVNEFLAARGLQAADGTPLTFRNVFADWMVANLLDRPNHSHGYDGLSVRADHRRSIRPGTDPRPAELSQYGVDYILVRRVEGPAVIGFSGAATTHLLPTAVPDGSCWWSNRGDNIASTLTAAVTVPAADGDGAGAAPALSFLRWHEIENEWDYAYIAASADGGATWRALPATGTTDADPVGNSYGPGYTGSSAGWQNAAADLSDYAGRDILLRFQYVTDEAIHAPGFCVREIGLSEGGADAVPIPIDDWAADGFVRVNNQVFQEWIVQVIIEGNSPSVAWLPLQYDAGVEQWRGTVAIDAGAGDTVTVAIAPVAPATKESAAYEVWVAMQ